MENKCVICFKAIDSLCDSQFISFCKSCKLTILKDGEIAVQKAKIEAVIEYINADGQDYIPVYVRKTLIKMLEDLKK